MATNQNSNKNTKTTASKKTTSSTAKKTVKPAEKTVTKSVAKTTTKPSAKAKTSTAEKTTAKKSPSKTATKSTTKTVAKPAPKTAVKPAAKVATKSAAKKTTKTTSKTIVKPVAKPVAKPAEMTAVKETEKEPVGIGKTVDGAERQATFVSNDQFDTDNQALKALLEPGTADPVETYANNGDKKKKWIKIGVAAAAAILVILLLIFGIRGCTSSRAKATATARENTLALAQSYIDKGLYDEALGLLNGLVIKDPNDADAQTLLAQAADLKRAADAQNGANGGNGGNYSVNIDTSGLTDGMNQTINSLKDQIAQQNEANAKQQERMNQLLAQQQQQAQNEKQAQAEQKAQQEAEAKQREKEEADRKAKEAELAKQDAAFKELMDRVDDEIKQGEGCLNLADTSGALKHFEKAKSLLPTSNSDRDRQYSASKLGEIAMALFDSSQNASTPAKDAETQEDKAADYANDSVTKYSHEGPSHYVLGMRAFHMKSYDVSEHELKLAIQEDTSNFLYYYQLGRVQATVKKYSDARSSFTSSIKYNGNYASAQYNLGFVLERLNKTNEALAAYRKAYSIDPNYEKAHIASARILSRTQNYTEAIAEFKEAIRINPASISTYQEEGLAYSMSGNKPEAENCFRKALALLKPGEKDPVTYYNLSSVLLEQGKNDDALSYAKMAYDSKDNATQEVKVNSVYNYALVYDKMGDADKAIALYKEVLVLDSSNVKAKCNLAALSNANNDPDTALTLLRSAYAKEPKNFEVNNNMGNAYLLKKDYNNAITSFQNALKIEPKNNTVRTNLAQAYQSAQQYDNAKTTYLDVIKYDNSNWDAYVELGKVCVAQKDNATAEKYLLYVQTKQPDFRSEEVKKLLALTKDTVLEK